VIIKHKIRAEKHSKNAGGTNMKFDKDKIEGYSSMSAEEKVAALEAYDFPSPDYSGYVKKELFDKTASDLADWKKKHNALLSEEDRKKQESEESIKKMERELAELRRDKTISEHKAQFIGLGYEESLAAETATAMADGDLAKVFANQKKFLEEHDKNLKANAMKNTPTPPAGSGAKAIDYDRAIAEANARGDMASAAALIREQHESLNGLNKSKN
jgi:hypothetical protein